MRNPGRCDGDDARSDSTDPMLAQTGAGDVPADDATAVLRVPDAPRLPFAAGDDGLSDLDDDLPDDAADFDDLLFDPLLSDEPIDLAAVRADDALIDALGGLGGLDSANDAVDPDDPLIAMLAAWAASARPETTRPDTAAETTGDAVPLLRSVPEIPADEPVGTPTTAVEPAARMDQPTVRLSAPARPAEDSPTDERDDSSAAPAVAASGPTAPVIGLLSRARALRRRSRPGGRPLPSRSPAAPGGGRRRRRGAGDQWSRSQRRYRRAGRPGMGDHQGVLRGAGAVDRGRSSRPRRPRARPDRPQPTAAGDRQAGARRHRLCTAERA